MLEWTFKPVMTQGYIRIEVETVLRRGLLQWLIHNDEAQVMRQGNALFSRPSFHLTTAEAAEQLQRDREVARHHCLSTETVQGDMRDFSCLREAAFDIAGW